MTTKAAPVAKTRFPLGLTIATVIAMAILVALGAWQLQRLTWKENLLARVAALQGAPPRALEPTIDSVAFGADRDFTRVVVDCPGLGTAPYLELYSVRDVGAGVRLISACRIAAGRYDNILVDRGFVSDQAPGRPKIDPADRAPMHLVGVLRKPDRATFVTPKNDVARNHWYSRDVPAMAAVLHATGPAPLILMAETSTNPELKALDPQPLPTEIPNRHFEYALTWFGLAGALACVYAATLWKWWKG
jgi:surfeit locus 1 family protein